MGPSRIPTGMKPNQGVEALAQEYIKILSSSGEGIKSVPVCFALLGFLVS
jgi:hypothetical protein